MAFEPFLKRLAMKKLLFSCLGLVCIPFFFGCRGGASDSVKASKDSNAARINTRVKGDSAGSTIMLSKADADFVVDAVSGEMMEVELGKVAQTHSARPDVKSLGNMMVTDGREGVKELKRLAERRHVVLPDSISVRQQEEIKKLRKKKGDDFDQAYVRLVAEHHREDVEEFGKQASDGTDSLTRVFASKSLQMLRRHLDSANKLEGMLGLNKINKPMPPH